MIYVLGGSRHIFNLPLPIINLIEERIIDKADFYIGDAPGSDTAFQTFVAKKRYNNVKIFSSAGYVRNNVGKWNFELIDSGLKSKSNSVHAFKDRHMCKLSDSGIMIWDGKSSGTMSNVIDLVQQGKNCYIWDSVNSDLINFDFIGSLEKWLDQYPEVKEESFNRLARFEKRKQKRENSQIHPQLFN